jgi:succinyl-diaminopimelate desuccinylase
VGHTDTVPPKAGEAPPRRDGQRIYGLGSSDMKGGLAVMLALAERLPFAALPVDVGFVFYDREEGPWSDSGLGPALDATPWLRDAALAFCLEPSDNEVQVGCLGTMHARVIFHGRAAHSARPWQGDNAIHAAGPLLVKLGARAPRDLDCGGHRFREVMSATLAQGGRARNVIPDRFEINVNFRFAPGRSLDDAEAELRAFAAPAEVEITERAPSGRVVTDNPLLARFLAQNGNRVTAKQAWTDVARLSAAGIDAVNLGPGLSAQAHQAGEYAEIDLLHASYRQFDRFLRGA